MLKKSGMFVEKCGRNNCCIFLAWVSDLCLEMAGTWKVLRYVKQHRSCYGAESFAKRNKLVSGCHQSRFQVLSNVPWV